jgi:hypothetical protein
METKRTRVGLRFLVITSPKFGQTAAVPLAFEVASIKPSQGYRDARVRRPDLRALLVAAGEQEENGPSGRPLGGRQDVQLLVYRLDRLGRDTRLTLEAVAELE